MHLQWRSDVTQRQAKTIRAVGLDFGTTNSALAVMHTDGTMQLATFQDDSQVSTTFRSVLYFFHPAEDEHGGQRVVAGPQAIRSYLQAQPKGRFMQSIKSFLASRLFERTRVFARLYTLEDLIAIIVQALRSAAEAQFGALGTARCGRTPGAFHQCHRRGGRSVSATPPACGTPRRRVRAHHV
jgi:hypothetical chaperone protein